MTKSNKTAHCDSCGLEAPLGRTCPNCGALLSSASVAPRQSAGPAPLKLLTATTADVLNGDEKAFAYLASLAVRAATGELNDSLRAELTVVAERAGDDPVTGDLAAEYAHLLLVGSPDWYPRLRRLRAKLVADDRVDAVALVLATTTYARLDIRTGHGQRRVDAVLDALHSDNSANDIQVLLESIVIRLAPDEDDEEASSWLPLARQIAPVVSMGAAMLGHPWVALAIDGAASLSPDSKPVTRPAPVTDVDLARQLGLMGLLIYLSKGGDPEAFMPLLDEVPALVDTVAAQSDDAARIVAEFLCLLGDFGFGLPRRKVKVVGVSLPVATLILDKFGWSVVAHGVRDGSPASIWNDANWRVTLVSFKDDRAEVTATKH